MPEREDQGSTPPKDARFPYDDRPVHRPPAEEHPLETLSGRGQTELTPMGLGPLAWVLIAVVALMMQLILGGYALSLLR